MLSNEVSLNVGSAYGSLDSLVSDDLESETDIFQTVFESSIDRLSSSTTYRADLVSDQ